LIHDDDARFCDLFPSWVRTVAIVSPASPSDTVQVDTGITLLAKAGIRVKVMPHARECENTGYTAIAAAKRVADLEQAWLDPDVDLILCTRGGIGSEDLLPLMNWDNLCRRDMPLVGFSNITALHCAMLVRNAGHPYSGPSLSALLGCDLESLKRFRDSLSGVPLEPVQLKVLRSGSCGGIAMGGHLILLEKLCRTDFCPDTAGKVIFIECPGQSAVVMRDKLDHLFDAGFFKSCAGVVFGHLGHCDASAVTECLQDDFARTVSCPVFSGYPYGHEPDNYMLDFRRAVAIDGNGLISS